MLNTPHTDMHRTGRVKGKVAVFPVEMSVQKPEIEIVLTAICRLGVKISAVTGVKNFLTPSAL